MRQLSLAVALISVLSSSAAAQEQANQIGRYQIITSNLAAKFTFLLDTVTGQVWQFAKYTDVNGDPELWEPMTRRPWRWGSAFFSVPFGRASIFDLEAIVHPYCGL